MSKTFDQEKIELGKDWAEAEVRSLAIERSVKIHTVVWNASESAQVWIASIESSAGEHTIALSYSSLELAADDERERIALRERLRGLVGDLMRIERRGYLR